MVLINSPVNAFQTLIQPARHVLTIIFPYVAMHSTDCVCPLNSIGTASNIT